ncbi:DNA polymerase alpha subunit B [Pleurotus pulmonarius]
MAPATIFSTPDLATPPDLAASPTIPSTPTRTKRHSTGDADERPAKRPKLGPLTGKAPQAAGYALELMASTCRRWATGLVVIDKRVCLHYYDRVGAIFTAPFSFDKEPWKLALFALAIGQCDLVQAGFEPLIASDVDRPLSQPLISLRDAILRLPKADIKQGGQDGVEYTGGVGPGVWSHFKVTGDPLYVYGGVTGRGSHVLPGRLIPTPEKDIPSDAVEGAEETKSPAIPTNSEMVAKLSWPMTKRPQLEAATISELVKKLPWLERYLPRVHCAITLKGESMGLPRRLFHEMTIAFGLEQRYFTLLFTDRYRHLWEVKTLAQFQVAYLDIVECHYTTTRYGKILHRDISENNLLWSDAAGRVTGVLNDWDLATPQAAMCKSTNHRTGTGPFMALDLLDPVPPIHVYRHDLESLFYVLIWAAVHYDIGSDVPHTHEVHKKLEKWTEAYETAHDAKASFIWKPASVLNCIKPAWRPVRQTWLQPLCDLFLKAQVNANRLSALQTNAGNAVEIEKPTTEMDLLAMRRWDEDQDDDESLTSAPPVPQPVAPAPAPPSDDIDFETLGDCLTFQNFMAALGSRPIGIPKKYQAYAKSLLEATVTTCDERAQRVHLEPCSSSPSMSSRTLDQLREIFGTDVSDEKLLKECADICESFNLTPRDFSFKVEAESFKFSAPRGSALPTISLDICNTIRQTLRRQAEAQGRTKVALRAARGRGGLNSAPVRGAGRHHLQARAGVARVKVEPGSEPTNLAYAGPSKVAFQGPPRTDKRSYRYMYEKIYERSEVLDNRIDEFAEMVREHYHIEELGDPCTFTNEPIYVVGRIVPQVEGSSADGSGKLADSSLALESSRMMGSGRRVPLRFEPTLKIRGGPKGVTKSGFFPGMITALKGRNGGGGWFAVDEVICLPPLKSMPPVKTEAFSIQVAAGPYTLDTDLSFGFAKSFFNSLKASKPSVVLLLGPFVDSSHQCIREGDVDMSPSEMFEHHFLAPLKGYLNAAPGSLALIVPNVRDINSNVASFPQAGFDPSLISNDDRIKLLPNPARFSLNGLSFGATSIDVLFHLRKEELIKHGEYADWVPPAPATAATAMTAADATGFIDTVKHDPNPIAASPAHTSGIPLQQPQHTGDVKMETDSSTPLAAAAYDGMSSLCQHLLRQRSFYPLFPVPVDLAHDVNLDISHSGRLRVDLGSDDGGSGLGVAPNILILPSRLKHFVKPVDHAIAINPSFLSKGTFATISVAACSDDSVPLTDRIAVDFGKLSS